MHRAFAVLVLSVFVAGLIGCGGSSEPSGGESGQAASSAPAPPQLSGPPPGAAPGGAPAAAPAAAGGPAAGAEGGPAPGAEGGAAPQASSGVPGEIPPGGTAGGPPPGAFPPGMVPGVGTMPSGGSSGSPPPGYTGGSPPPGMNPSAATGATAGGPPPGAFPPGMVPGVGTMPSGGSSGSPPPGSAGGSPPAGYSGGSPPPGYSGGSPPPGYSGGSPPPGYAGGGSPPQQGSLVPGAQAGAPQQGSLVPGAQAGTPGGSTPGVPAGYPGMPPGAGGPGGLTAPGAESPAGGTSSGVPAGYPGMPGGYPGMPGGAGAPGLAGAGGTPGAPGAAPAAPPGYNTLAQNAFSQGRESDALKYLCAYALTSDEGASEILPKIQWCSGLAQPVLAVRWGVGAVVTPDSYKSDLKPVGSNQALPQKKGKQGGPDSPSGAAPAMPGPGMMRPEGGMGGLGSATGAGSNAVLAQFAGELGERFLTDFQARVQGGNFGEVLRDAPPPGTVAAGGSSGYGGGSPAGYSGGPPPGMGGAPGMAIGAGAESPSGHMGPPAGMGGPPGMGGGAVGARPAAAGAVPQITTGLCFLGLDTQERLLQKAAKEGVQVLVLLNIKITVNRKTSLITNETSLQLINVAKKEKPLYATGDFNNLKIQNERASNKNDGVKEEFDKLFKFIDGNLVVSAPPASLNAANVLGRVSTLAAAKHDNVLPVLAEIRFWNRKNLLPEPELVNAYKQLLGEEQGNQLATGDEAAKKKAVEKLLPRS